MFHDTETVLTCSKVWILTNPGLEVIFLVHLQSFASKIFFHQQTGETTSKLFPFVWETWIILTRNRLLVDIFLTRRLSKSLPFGEFASVNFEPCNQVNINRRVQLILITLNIDYSKGCETSVNVNTSPFQDYGHPDNHIPATYETTPAFINLPQYYLFSYIPYIT